MDIDEQSTGAKRQRSLDGSAVDPEGLDPSKLTVTMVLEMMAKKDKEYQRRMKIYEDQINDLTKDFKEVKNGAKQKQSPPAPSVATKNRFATLSATPTAGTSSPIAGPSTATPSSSTPATTKVVKQYVPPVYIKQTTKEVNRVLYQNFRDSDYELRAVSGNRTCLKAASREVLLRIKSDLESRRMEFFSFTARDEKEVKVALKGLDEYNPTEILQEMLADDQVTTKPTDVKRLRTPFSRQAKHDLDIFTVSYPAGTTMAAIQCTKFLFRTRVQFESLKSSGNPIQCYRCQQFGHATAGCRMSQKCVKCAGDHESADCTYGVTADRAILKCVLCGERGHPASYKGCEKAKEAKANYKKRFDWTQKKGQQQEQQAPVSSREQRKRRNGPQPVTEQPQPRGDWAGQRSSGYDDDQEFKREMREFMASMSKRVDFTQNVLHTMARSFGRKLNIPDQDVNRMLNPNV